MDTQLLLFINKIKTTRNNNIIVVKASFKKINTFGSKILLVYHSNYHEMTLKVDK